MENRRILIKAASGLLAVLLSVSVAGCGGGKGIKMSSSTKQFAGAKEQNQQGIANDGESVLPADSEGAVTDNSRISVTGKFRQSYADFAIRLLEESRAQEPAKNTMLSPLSAMMALEMTRSGAVGETEIQMANTLYGQLASEEGRQQLLSYMNHLPKTEETKFHFANSLWFRNQDTDFTPGEDFLKNAEEEYQASVYGAPFDESTVKDINIWIEQETDGMIKDMLKEIDADTIMYLINAMAFDAKWREPYEEYQVREEDFFPKPGETQRAEMMYGEEGSYLEDEKTIGFLKEYEGGYGFAALLPKEETDIDEYLKNLSGEDFTALMDGVQYVPVKTGMPKFFAETGVSLKAVLKNMGMPVAFSEEEADFSGMGKAGGNIYIGDVMQNTFIEVSEQGTRAGAATVVEMKVESAMEEPAEPKEVILNRPFVYAIVDMESKSPIFFGIMETAE